MKNRLSSSPSAGASISAARRLSAPPLLGAVPADSRSRRSMSPAQVSAICRSSSRVRSPNGCGMTAIGISGYPSAAACERPSVSKAVEQIASAGSLRFAASTVSWILHDVQDPQSPDPVITASQFSA
jgi:hypothetical protein